jgi:xanthine/uracil permease
MTQNVQPPADRSLGAIWSAVDRPIKTAAVVMWVSGLLLLGFGTYMDFDDGWSSQPFLTNIVSGIVGALIGIPLVGIFAQYFIARASRSVARAFRHEQVLAAVVELNGFLRGQKEFRDIMHRLSSMYRRLMTPNRT